MGRSQVWAGVLLATTLGAVGCGSSPGPLPQWTLYVAVGWPNFPPTRDQFGYSVSIQLRPYGPTTSVCPAWPDAMQIQVNGQEIAATFDESACEAQATLGPALQVDPLSVVLLDGPTVVAHGEFDDLAPGTKATLVAPADGTFHAGDDILVVPPPELPTGETGLAIFYALDADTWSPMGTPGTPQRLADGIHVTAPALAGQVALTFDGRRPSASTATIKCTGFALCEAGDSFILGPVLLVGAP